MKADHKKVKHQLAIAKGQLDGISKMIDEDCYCVDIYNQLSSTIAILKKVNAYIISAHLESCIKESKDSQDLDKKIEEINQIIAKLS